MFERLSRLFSETFMPHGHCYLWEPGLVWLHVVSDGLIALAYVAIFTTLVVLVRRVKDIPFQWMYLCFAVFIVTCGLTHAMEVWNVWSAHYWLAGTIKAVTAVASVATALMLPPLVPRALAIAEAARLSHERGIKLEAAHKELEAAFGRTRELEQLKTQFFANVSHELRTPLALVLGPIDKWLAEPALAPALRDDLELAGRNARTLLKHVNDLLDVSKLEAGRMAPSYARVDLARAVKLTASRFEGVAAERAIAFDVATPEALPAELDPDLFDRVLVNLLSNAFKFTPDAGKVRVTLETLAPEDGTGERARLAVADSGPGVPASFRAHAFERFRQADASSTRSFGGTGLGLAIAKDLTELHHGRIALGDAPEGGALFTVELPLAAPEGTTVRTETAPAPQARDPLVQQAVEELRSSVAAVASGASDRPTLLVVEDNAEMARFIVETLASEYRCERAADGEEGLRRALELRPDLILSDVMMPRMSGDELLRALRERPELDAVPVLLLTAKADDELRVRMLREGAQDYVLKPFSSEELRARVRNLVTVKRAREVLQSELATHTRDLARLASEVSARKREVEHALETARIARDHAVRGAKLKSDFVSMVSHELKTPLTTLLLQVHSLERSPANVLGERHREAVRRMATSVRRLDTMVSSLLEFARIEAGRIAVSPVPVRLAPLANEVVEAVRPQAIQKGLELRVVTPPEGEVVETDPRIVRVVLANLLANAVKFTEAGAVELAVERTNGTCTLRVTDTGRGIPADKRATIFEPFTHLEAIDAKTVPGIGLGLAIVRDLVRALGGTIDLDSRPGAGSTFRVTLPVRH